MSIPMKCRVLAALLAALAASAAPAVAAQELSCPQPGTWVQVVACQPPDQLRQSYTGYCSDNRRLYGRDSDTCTSFENFLQAKNTARWESADGAFEGYLSCQPGAGAAASLPPATMSLERQGAITVVSCRYGNAATLNHRTRASCTLVDAAACAALPGTSAAACRARCN